MQASARLSGSLWTRGPKRAFDVALSLLALIAALPVLAIAVLAVKLGSPGPLLFRQDRSGR